MENNTIHDSMKFLEVSLTNKCTPKTKKMVKIRQKHQGIIRAHESGNSIFLRGQLSLLFSYRFSIIPIIILAECFVKLDTLIHVKMHRT